MAGAMVPAQGFVNIDDWQGCIEYLKTLVDNSTIDNYWKISKLAQSYLLPPHGLKAEYPPASAAQGGIARAVRLFCLPRRVRRAFGFRIITYIHLPTIEPKSV